MDVAVVVVVAAEAMIDVIDHEGKNRCEFFFKENICYISSRDRRQRSGSPPARDRRRGGGGSRSRSPRSRSPVPRR